MNAIPTFEDETIFCSNPRCLLHIRCNTAGVVGRGNWAVLPGGLVIGRGIYDGRMLCDACGSGRSLILDETHRTGA